MSGLNQPSLETVIDDFRTDLSDFDNAKVLPLPNLIEQIPHDGKFVRASGFEEPGIYLDKESNRNQLYAEGATYWFQTQPGNRLTREDSHNFVFFGRLWAVPEHDGPERHAQVAVKSMEHQQRAGLIGELAMFQYLHELQLPTFTPAGIVIGQKKNHLLTHFDGPVTTMDTVEWQELTQEESWVEVGKVVDTLSLLHSKYLFHGDAYFRNIAFNERNDVVIVDPELMTSGRDFGEQLAGKNYPETREDRIALDSLTKLMSRDFSDAAKSIDEQIFRAIPKKQRPRNDAAKFKAYREHLFEPYHNQIKDLPEPERTVLLQAYGEMIRRKKELAKKNIV